MAKKGELSPMMHHDTGHNAHADNLIIIRVDGFHRNLRFKTCRVV